MPESSGTFRGESSSACPGAFLELVRSVRVSDDEDVVSIAQPQLPCNAAKATMDTGAPTTNNMRTQSAVHSYPIAGQQVHETTTDITSPDAKCARPNNLLSAPEGLVLSQLPFMVIIAQPWRNLVKENYAFDTHEHVFTTQTTMTRRRFMH